MAKGGSRYGAGRPGWHRKAESCLRLDVRALARRNLLGGGHFSWNWTNTHTGEHVGAISAWVSQHRLELTYSTNGQPVAQTIGLERTPCRLGGSRPWLRCGQCHRRVAVVFFGGRIFACRRCSRVAYSSQSEDALGRGWRRQAKLEARLGENWTRPPGMRQATYERICERLFDCEDERHAELDAFVTRMMASGAF